MAMKPIEILINAKDNASGVFDRLNGKLKVVGAAIAGYFGIKAFAGIVEGAADFEQAMSRVQAATGASAQEMAQLNQAAQDAGATTKFSATETAGALENLAKAGLSAGDSIQALPAVLALAQAGDIDLGQASEYVTKAVMGMGLAFTDAARVADVLALGANATNTSVEGLAQALSYAAPIAQAAGVSLEGTVAIMGKLADAGIDASRSGTAVANMMSQFSDSSSPFKRALAEAGITTNNFEQALHQLAIAGPKGEKAILAVGLNAGPALRSLLNQGMGALDELKTKLEGSAGSAAAAAKVMQDNLAGSMGVLGNVWKTVSTALGTPVLPVLKDGVDQLAAALRGAVADGTIGKFGEAIAAAFQSGIKWVKEFVGSVDFTKLAADLRAFADRSSEVFTQVGEAARNAGDIVKTAYGVMAGGTNAVLAGIYGLGLAYSETAAFILKKAIALNEGLAKISFGGAKERIIAETEGMKIALAGLNGVSEEFGTRMRASFGAAADAARLAQEGATGLAGAMRGASGEASAAADAQGKLTQELTAGAEAAAAAAAAYQKKVQADEAAKMASEEHSAALAKLRAEYAQLIADGSLQEAAAKLDEINQKLRETPNAASGAADAAKQVAAAFERLGVVSTAILKDQAAAALRDYETIRNAGTSTAEDIALAFKSAADKAIAANKGVAPSWVEAEAATRGYKIEVDAAGRATLKAGDDAEKATGRAAEGWRGAASAAREATEAAAKYRAEVDKKYGRAGQSKSLSTIDRDAPIASQWVWTRAAIIDYLQSAGLDENLAEELAKQFVKSDGTVDYMASNAQKKWGGKNSTLAEALGKMVDYYKYTDQGKAEAANRQAYLGGKGQPAEPAAPQGGQGGQGGRTGRTGQGGGSGISSGAVYVSNYNITGIGAASFQFDSPAAQRLGDDLIRRLADARRTSAIR